MRTRLDEATIQKMHDLETSDLTERQKMAIRLADKLASDHTSVDGAFVAGLREHFSEDELVDLGMSIAFLLGWGRFIEAFGILPDAWRDGAAAPWEPRAEG